MEDAGDGILYRANCVICVQIPFDIMAIVWYLIKTLACEKVSVPADSSLAASEPQVGTAGEDAGTRRRSGRAGTRNREYGFRSCDSWARSRRGAGEFCITVLGVA